MLVRLRRIHPDTKELTAEAAVSEPGLRDLAPEDRPYIVLNMISTADGRATISGRTREMGNDADRELFHALRGEVDAVMVGAGTLRVERYGRLVRDRARRERREREGLAPDPLACVVSGRLDLPGDLPLLQDSQSRVVVLTSSEEEIGEVPAQVEYLRGGTHPLELRPLVERLRGEYDLRLVLCEGGPTLNGWLLGEGLVDELFLSVAPKLDGDAAAPTIVEGRELPGTVELELASALESEGHLFLRYRVQR